MQVRQHAAQVAADARHALARGFESRAPTQQVADAISHAPAGPSTMNQKMTP